MIDPSADTIGFRFGSFELDLSRDELRNRNGRLHIQQQPFRVLVLLVSRADEVVTREEIHQQIWGDETFVDFEHGLNFCVRQLRIVLGDSARRPKYIETLRGVGYRFVMPVEGVRVTVSEVAQQRQGRQEQRRRRRVSVALAPFDVVGDDPTQEQFTDALIELLLPELTDICALRVVPRSALTAARQRHQSYVEVARALNADVVLQGSTRWSRQRVRIAAQLVHARTGLHLWAESYERNVSDPLALQSAVARAIATEVRIRLTLRERASWRLSQPASLQALEEYLRGRFFWNRRTEDALRKGAAYFESAIAKAPGFALAYTGLADSYNMLGYYVGPPSHAYPKAKAAALKALEIDETLPEARTSLGFVSFFYEWDTLAAEREFKRAIELNPRHANAHHWYALCLAAVGRLDESIAEIKRAQELDPLSLIIDETVGWIFHFGGEYDLAIDQYRRTLELDPSFMPAHDGLALALEQKGLFKDALAEFNQAITFSGGSPHLIAARGHTYAVSGRTSLARKTLSQLQKPLSQQYVSQYDVALIYAGLGDSKQAIGCLENAFAERATGLVWLRAEPRFSALRGEPRFRQLLKLVGLPEIHGEVLGGATGAEHR
jgi:TolB-like protein/Flp pilus assembly protein TadD